MWFWIAMFICNLLMPGIMIIGGLIMKGHSPKKINGVYGYRTPRSKKSKEAWDFAHKICGDLWMKYGWPLLIATTIVMIFIRNSSDDAIGFWTLGIEAVQLVFLLIPIYFTEKALKENFDENGIRKN